MGQVRHVVRNTVEGVDFSPAGIENIRDQLVIIRDVALDQAEFDWAVILSHAVAMLSAYKETIIAFHGEDGQS